MSEKDKNSTSSLKETGKEILSLLPFLDRERMKTLALYFKGKKKPEVMLAYEVYKNKLFNLDLAGNTVSAAVGVSRDLGKDLTAGVYVAETYENLLKAAFKPKIGIGLGWRF